MTFRALVWEGRAQPSQQRQHLHALYCDCDIVKAIQYAGKKMHEEQRSPVIAGEGGGE